MKSPALMLLFALLFPVMCAAADKDGNYGSTLPAKFRNCDKYLDALDACMAHHCAKQIIYSTWLNGYVTAYNTYVNDTYNILGKRDLSSLNYWLANYCKKNPNISFDTAVENLMIKLAPERTIEQP